MQTLDDQKPSTGQPTQTEQPAEKQDQPSAEAKSQPVSKKSPSRTVKAIRIWMPKQGQMKPLPPAERTLSTESQAPTGFTQSTTTLPPSEDLPGMS